MIIVNIVLTVISFQDDYLQIDLGTTYRITNIAVQGSATSYCIRYGKDGKAYKPYGTDPSICEVSYFSRGFLIFTTSERAFLCCRAWPLSRRVMLAICFFLFV
jgi:hypothetical protein